MMRVIRVALVMLTVPVSAQTDDAFWRHWTSREATAAPRAIALGGADVALTDDASSSASNPALPATLWRHEYGAAFGTGRGTGLGQLGAGRWSPHGLAGAVSLRRPVAVSARTSSDRLDAELTEVGVQIARRRGPHLALGLGLSATRLTLTGESAVVHDGARVRAGAGADSTRLGAALGAAWESSLWTAAVAVHSGATFAATRTATRNGVWDDAGSNVSVRRPWRASMGGVARPTLRLSLYAQADLRGAGGLRRVARSPSSSPLVPERAGLAALRAGAQYALPLQRFSVIVRAGVARSSEAGLRELALDRSGARARPATSPARTRLTSGLGVAFDRATLDVAHDGAGRWTMEIRLRRS